jgi:hypothetical protein
MNLKCWKRDLLIPHLALRAPWSYGTFTPGSSLLSTFVNGPPNGIHKDLIIDGLSAEAHGSQFPGLFMDLLVNHVNHDVVVEYNDPSRVSFVPSEMSDSITY